MWWNGWRKRDFKDLSMSSLVGRCSSHVSWSFYRPRQLQTVTSKDVWCRCTPDNFSLVWRYEFKRLCNYSRNDLLEMHRDTYVSSPQTENTVLAPNDNHIDGYGYFLFKFLSSLLVLLLFLFGFYFFLNIKRRVSWWRSFILHERRHSLKSLVPSAAVRAKLLAKIEKLKASEQSSFPLPGKTIEIAENEPLMHGTPTCSKNLDDSNDIALAKKGNDL